VERLVDLFPPRRPASPIRGRQLCPHQVLVEHDQLGAKVVIVLDDAGHGFHVGSVSNLEAVPAGCDLVPFGRLPVLGDGDWSDPDRVEDTNLANAGR